MAATANTKDSLMGKEFDVPLTIQYEGVDGKIHTHVMNIVEKVNGVCEKPSKNHVIIKSVEFHGERDQHINWIINDKYLIDCDLTYHLLK